MEVDMRWVLNIFAGLLVLIGLVWILQGINVLLGSPMSGHIQYTFIGLVVAGLGVVLLVSGYRRPRLPKNRPPT
jgi:hypothetical protein